MINTLIVDDEQFSVDALKRYASQIPFLNVVLATTSSIEASIAVQKQQIDLVFSDIHMPELSGLDLVRSTQGKCKVIFVTAYSDYALEGYQNDVIDYLVKPIPFDKFLKSAQKAERLIELEKGQLEQPAENAVNNFLMIKTDHKGKYIKIKYDDIIFIEGTGNYLTICTTNQEKITTLLTIKALVDLLPQSQFMRVHKSYIASLQHITGLDGNDVVLGKAVIPIGVTYKQNLIQHFGDRMV
jgi:DNA-binding LytR/AlgR family response regulator